MKVAVIRSMAVLTIVVAAGITSRAQGTAPAPAARAAVSRTPAPETPVTEPRSRNEIAFRARSTPASGLPFRGQRFPVIPLSWGWGGVPLALGVIGPPLEEGPSGGLQLDVQPWRASVYADGKHVGRVEDFSGYYRPLELTAGHHEIVIVEPGYQPLVFEALVVPGRTSTYRGTLQY